MGETPWRLRHGFAHNDCGWPYPQPRVDYLSLTVKTPEQEAALRSIRKLIEFWRIEPEELQLDEGSVVRPAPVVFELKYRHPVSGETWDGQGVQPPWLRLALTKQGYTVEELRCRSTASDVGLPGGDD